MTGQCGIFQSPVGELRLDERVQVAGQGEVVTPAKQAQDGAERREWEDIRAAQSQPDALEVCDAGFVGGGGKVGAVDRPHRGPDDKVGGDLLSVQRLEHADLHGTEAAAAGQYERSSSGFMLIHANRPTTHPSPWGRGQPCNVVSMDRFSRSRPTDAAATSVPARKYRAVKSCFDNVPSIRISSQPPAYPV
ncbi:hypothetical protein D3C71_1293570 [compost metagenome]